MSGAAAVHIGILGGGGISETHARAASSIEGARVVAVGGANPLKVQALAERYGAAAYADIEALLRHRPMEVLLSAIRTGSEPRCNGPEGRRSVALVEALYHSASTGQPVELPQR